MCYGKVKGVEYPGCEKACLGRLITVRVFTFFYCFFIIFTFFPFICLYFTVFTILSPVSQNINTKFNLYFLTPPFTKRDAITITPPCLRTLTKVD